MIEVEQEEDGRWLAEVLELPRTLDFNFVVRLRTSWLGVIPRHRIVFHSPDEGPPRAERFLWSRDGRHLVLLGTRFFAVRPEACLASGEWLYLLVDTSTGRVHANTEQSRLPPFSLDDVRAMDLGMALASGVVDPISRRCVAMR